MQTNLLDAPPGGAPDELGAPEPERPSARTPFHRLALTFIVAFGPVVTAGLVIAGGITPIPWVALALAVVFYLVIGHGVTIGFHRLFTHGSFEARRPLKIVLAVIGSMSFQGSLIGWVADHRRHHRHSDRPGDPHSPWLQNTKPLSKARGLWHAHAGWFFHNDSTSRSEYAADLLADPDLVLIDRLFVPCCIATLALPFALGFAITQSVAGGVAALVWAGILRVGFSHNFTWSINSVCHRFGKQPFRTKDHSGNVAWLAPVTAGESWHNAHHAFPSLARHGVDRGQLDTSAVMIRLFERLGWATNVRWPVPAVLDSRRVSPT